VVNDSADVTSAESSFQVCGPATGRARLPTVDSLSLNTHVHVSHRTFLITAARAQNRLPIHVCEKY